MRENSGTVDKVCALKMIFKVDKKSISLLSPELTQDTLQLKCIVQLGTGSKLLEQDDYVINFLN